MLDKFRVIDILTDLVSSCNTLGCHFLRRDNELTFGDGSFHEPVVLDLTKAGSMTLNKQDSFGDSGSYCFDPYVRIPGQNRWERVQNVVFGLVSLDPPNNSKYKLSVSDFHIYHAGL